MSKNSILPVSGYSLDIKVDGRSIKKSSGFIRMSENETLMISLRTTGLLPGEVKPRCVRLHSNLGGEWAYTGFSETGSGLYSLEITKPPCGRFSFRLAVEGGDTLYWEPVEYHELLVDPGYMDSIRLYTLIPNISGTAADWIKKLPLIAGMGFNAVHILPVTVMGSSESPYAAADLFKLDSLYGRDMDDFREFTSAASELGIKICLDIVLNHVSNENLICREHAEWIVPDGKRDDGLKRAGCYHHEEWISWEDLVLINYDHPVPGIRNEIYSYMLNYVVHWIEAAGGSNVMMRLDNLHSSNREFIKWLLPELRRRYPDLLVLSEFFGAEHHLDEAVVDFGLNLLTANSWEYPFAPVLERYIAGIHRSAKLRYLVEPTSHDTEAAARLFGTARSSIPRYAACALMGTGVTGIVQGYEYGLPEKINFIGKTQEKPVKSEFDFTEFIKAVNHLIEIEACLRKKGNAEFFDTGNDSLIVCRRRDSSGQCILIVINLDIYKEHRTYYNLIGKAEMVLSENAEAEFPDSGDRINIRLGACGVCVIRAK